MKFKKTLAGKSSSCNFRVTPSKIPRDLNKQTFGIMVQNAGLIGILVI